MPDSNWRALFGGDTGRQSPVSFLEGCFREQTPANLGSDDAPPADIGCRNFGCGRGCGALCATVDGVDVSYCLLGGLAEQLAGFRIFSAWEANLVRRGGAIFCKEPDNGCAAPAESSNSSPAGTAATFHLFECRDYRADSCIDPIDCKGLPPLPLVLSGSLRAPSAASPRR